MNTRTHLGKFLAKLRVDNDETLKDMASRIHLSQAFLSTVELGQRAAPSDFLGKVVAAYELSAAEAKELAKAIAEQKGSAPYIVCIRSYYVRDVQVFDPTGLTDDETEDLGRHSFDAEERWKDPHFSALFLDVVSAKSDEEAIRIVADEKEYDPRILFAIRVDKDRCVGGEQT